MPHICQRTCRIATRDTETGAVTQEEIEVLVQYGEYFAVTPSTDPAYVYTLTHLPTGHAVASGNDIERMRELARKLEPFDWDWTDPEQAEEMHEASAIVKQWKQRYS